jgi:ParB family chromosome partitioning protein
MSPRYTLGRGFSSLISDPVVHKTARESAVYRHLALESIRQNPEQPRVDFAVEGLERLALSIAEHGVLSPILVRQDLGERYVLIAGERRWRAAGKAGLTRIPAVVISEETSGREQLVLALVENVQRRDLNPVEEALGYKRLVDTYQMTQAEVARCAGKDRSTVTNMLRLLRLPQAALEFLRAGRISTGHAKALVPLAETSQLSAMLDQIVSRRLSVRETERMVSAILRPEEELGQVGGLTLPLRRAQDLLTRALTAQVRIKPKKSGGGRIEIAYANEEDLQAILERMQAHA